LQLQKFNCSKLKPGISLQSLRINPGKFMTLSPEEIACLSSAKTSNEDNYLMQEFAGVVLNSQCRSLCKLCHSSTVAGLACGEWDVMVWKQLLLRSAA